MDNIAAFNHSAEPHTAVASAPIPLLFLIRSLDFGGAQRQLIELIRNLDKQRFAITVATFYDGGELRPDFEQIAGVRVVSLRKQHRWDMVFFLARLAGLVWEVRPRIMHGYMSVANELSLVFGKLVGAKAVWGLRVSDLNTTQYNWAVGMTFRTGAWGSRFADLIIVNSHAGKHYHAQNGYVDRAMRVIPNGIDVDRFCPDAAAGQALRQQWGIASNELLIGQVSRLDPMKGHATFLAAAARLAQQRDDVRFVCVGDGLAEHKQKLYEQAEALGLGSRLIWAGATKNPLAAYNALDIATLASSHGEGFANVVGEAMACGVPCIVTDVGDSARIVGDATHVVPPDDPTALVDAWQRVLSLSAAQRRVLGQQNRQRITQQFSVQQLAKQTETHLMELLT